MSDSRLQTMFNKVYTHLLTQKAKAKDGQVCMYRDRKGRSCAVGCLIPDNRYRPQFEGNRVDHDVNIAEAADIQGYQEMNLATALQNIHDNFTVDEWPSALAREAGFLGLTVPELTPAEEPIQVVLRSRVERLRSLSSNGSISIQTVAKLFDCPEASVRRDIFHLRQAGWIIELYGGQIRCYGKRKDLANG